MDDQTKNTTTRLLGAADGYRSSSATGLLLSAPSSVLRERTLRPCSGFAASAVTRFFISARSFGAKATLFAGSYRSRSAMTNCTGQDLMLIKFASLASANMLDAS